MDFVQLQYFREVAKYEHITLVAEQLHMTQPALSKAISKLESELGVRLFDRDGKNIKLNDYGKVVLESANRIFIELEEMQSKISDLHSGVSGNIKVGSCFPGREPQWLYESLRDFAFSRQNVSLKMTQMNPLQLEKALLEREIDIALSTSIFNSTDICWTYLFFERLGIIMSENHRLASHDVVSISELKGERFLCNNSNSDVQNLTLSFCKKAGFTPEIMYEGDFPDLIGEAVSKNLGVSFIAEPQLRVSERDKPQPWASSIVFKNIEEDYCMRSCGIATLKNRYLPRAATDFCNYLIREFDPKKL